MESGILLLLFLATMGMVTFLAYNSKRAAEKAKGKDTSSSLDGLHKPANDQD